MNIPLRRSDVTGNTPHRLRQLLRIHQTYIQHSLNRPEFSTNHTTQPHRLSSPNISNASFRNPPHSTAHDAPPKMPHGPPLRHLLEAFKPMVDLPLRRTLDPRRNHPRRMEYVWESAVERSRRAEAVEVLGWGVGEVLWGWWGSKGGRGRAYRGFGSMGGVGGRGIEMRVLERSGGRKWERLRD